MPLLDLRTSTRTFGASSRLAAVREHAATFLRHMTPARAANILRAETARLRGRTTVRAMPFFLKVETTGVCNLDCAWCTAGRRERGEAERPIGSMSRESFDRILDETGRYLLRINLYGFGEPLLLPETFGMIREASSRNIGVAVSSNMNLHSPTLARDILDSGLELLILSCHGATPESVRRFMGGRADMRLALARTAELVRERDRRGSRYPGVHWQYCVTGFNEGEMEAARGLARETGVDAIRFIRPTYPPDAGDEWYSSLFPRRSATASDFGGRSCAWPWRGAYVNWDGGVLPCCRGELFPANDFGNVLEEPFRSIWNGPRYRECRKLIGAPGRYMPTLPVLCSTCPVLGFRPARLRDGG